VQSSIGSATSNSCKSCLAESPGKRNAGAVPNTPRATHISNEILTSYYRAFIANQLVSLNLDWQR
jgi:hypothetical protein